MPEYRRRSQRGGTFFFTLVTHQRYPLFSQDLCRRLLGQAFRDTCRQVPFRTIGIILLPEHLHCLWELPADDNDYSTRWARIKKAFTREWLLAGGSQGRISSARHKHRERGIWQRRFWEHQIRDQKDLIRHLDYIHYNPVKHGLVRCPHDWPYSSFHQWVRPGGYPANWACTCRGALSEPPVFDDLEETAME